MFRLGGCIHVLATALVESIGYCKNMWAGWAWAFQSKYWILLLYLLHGVYRELQCREEMDTVVLYSSGSGSQGRGQKRERKGFCEAEW